MKKKIKNSKKVKIFNKLAYPVQYLFATVELCGAQKSTRCLATRAVVRAAPRAAAPATRAVRRAAPRAAAAAASAAAASGAGRGRGSAGRQSTRVGDASADAPFRAHGSSSLTEAASQNVERAPSSASRSSEARALLELCPRCLPSGFTGIGDPIG